MGRAFSLLTKYKMSRFSRSCKKNPMAPIASPGMGMPGQEPIHNTIKTVRKKLRASYPEMTEEQVAECADLLSNWENIKEKYLRGLEDLTKAAVTEAIEEAQDFPDGYPNQRTLEDGQERMEEAVARVHRMQISLLLYEAGDENFKAKMLGGFKRFVPEFTYGPYHAAIQIGNIVLDWDDSSLVIPRQITASLSSLREKATNLIFHGNVHRAREGDVLPRVEHRFRPGAEEAASDFTKQVNIVLDLSIEKNVMINELASLIEKYNTKYYYGIFSCNCQRFVKEVLEVMGISKHADTFHGRLRKHEEILLKRGTHQVMEFNTHAMVDDYVRKHKDNLSEEDAEFCMCHYLLFHCWGKKHPSREAWKCDPSTCQVKFCKASA